MKILFTVLFMVVSFISTYPQDTIHVPRDYSTIQAGINAASNGDIVLVEEGTFIENINFRGKAITVASLFLVDGDTNHVNNTVIDGSQPSHPDSGSVVTFNSGEDTNSVLCGFTITGGLGTYVPSAPVLPVRNGGGIFCFMSGARIINNNIIENECIMELSGGHAIGGGICVAPPGTNAFVIIKKNKIINNLVWSKGNANSNSEAWGQGGGIAIYTDGLIFNNEFLSNTCKSDHGFTVGGAIRLNVGTVDLIENKIDQNLSIATESYGFAGGISCSWANTTISSNVITNNSVFGGIKSRGAAIYFDLNYDAYWAIVENNYIANNFSTYTNSYGGAIGMYTSSPKIINNIIKENSANYGGALHAFDNSKPVIINNTIAFNVANHSGGALYSEDVTSNPVFVNTILWNDSAAISGNEIELFNGGSVSVRYCDITGGWAGEGNIDIDPDFITGDDSLHLSESSPCIDVGIDSIEINSIWLYPPLTDIDKESRPYGSGFDIGSDEWHQPSTIKSNYDSYPSKFRLFQNYPNPFNPTTSIIFGLPEASEIKLTVFNSLGEEVLNLFDGYKTAGYHQVEFDATELTSRQGSALTSGVYFYQLNAGHYLETKKMVLIK